MTSEQGKIPDNFKEPMLLKESHPIVLSKCVWFIMKLCLGLHDVILPHMVHDVSDLCKIRDESQILKKTSDFRTLDNELIK